MCVLANLEYLSILFCTVFWAAAPGLVAVLPVLNCHVPGHWLSSGPSHCYLQMWLIVTNVPWSVCVHLLITTGNWAETLEMLFGVWTQVGSKSHALGGGSNPSKERANLGGISRPVVTYMLCYSQGGSSRSLSVLQQLVLCLSDLPHISHDVLCAGFSYVHVRHDQTRPVACGSGIWPVKSGVCDTVGGYADTVGAYVGGVGTYGDAGWTYCAGLDAALRCKVLRSSATFTYHAHKQTDACCNSSTVGQIHDPWKKLELNQCLSVLNLLIC